MLYLLFFSNVPAPPDIYTLSLHDALPIWKRPPYEFEKKKMPIDILCGTDQIRLAIEKGTPLPAIARRIWSRSEEHTSELQSLRHLVCRLLLEKKKITRKIPTRQAH